MKTNKKTKKVSLIDDFFIEKIIPRDESRNVGPYSVGEYVDCQDTVKKWLNAEILQVNMLT
jgi:hypothetical protein